jgi:hypothetical protein
MFEMFWIQARFHKFGSKASTNAGILLHSVHQKTVFHVRGEHSIFLLGTRERLLQPFSRSLAPKHTWIERAYNAYLEWSGARAPRSRLVSTPRDRLQYKNSFEEGALLRLQKIQIHAPCKPLAA